VVSAASNTCFSGVDAPANSFSAPFRLTTASCGVRGAGVKAWPSGRRQVIEAWSQFSAMAVKARRRSAEGVCTVIMPTAPRFCASRRLAREPEKWARSSLFSERGAPLSTTTIFPRTSRPA
jgi:hypothetical protein